MSTVCAVSDSRTGALVLFTEAVTNGTMAMLEYNYLVKKVVFKISILPIIKVIAATFIHVFLYLCCLSLRLLTDTIRVCIPCRFLL